MESETRKILKGDDQFPRSYKIADRKQRRLMRYYGQSTVDGIEPTVDLVAAVRRQSMFIDKMCHMLWLRSPSLQHTLEHAIMRYKNFFELFRLYPGKLIVPTLDIDLVWYTHQLCPSRYDVFCTSRTGRFINHDDKIGKASREDSFAVVEELYYKEFAEPYRICLCWDCEAIRDAVETRPPKSDGDLEELMHSVRQAVGNYRTAEVGRRLELRRRQNRR